MNNTPFFEINGERYEIKRNRYLQAEFDKMQEGNRMSREEEANYEKEKDFEEKLEKLSERKEALFNKYLETFDESDYQIYDRACEAYDRLFAESQNIPSVSETRRKRMLDNGEALIITALQLNDKGEKIRSKEEANEIWCTFVDENGKVLAMQFIIFTVNYIAGMDEENENPFIAQAKAKAEQKANMLKGIEMAK